VRGGGTWVGARWAAAFQCLYGRGRVPPAASAQSPTAGGRSSSSLHATELIPGDKTGWNRAGWIREGPQSWFIQKNLWGTPPAADQYRYRNVRLFSKIQSPFFSFFQYHFIQKCFICRPSDYTLSEDAGIFLLSGTLFELLHRIWETNKRGRTCLRRY
jgi:hypothetical protein